MNALLGQRDAVGTAVALLLLAMSVGSWVALLWKGYMLRRAMADLGRSTQAFWQAASLADGQTVVQAMDREELLSPLVQAALTQYDAQAKEHAAGSHLGAAGDLSTQLTRVLRDALHGVLHRLQAGQVLLATVGATAPFVGLLGTVWGIYHALVGIAGAGLVSIDKISGPVGEALIMTAAGLAVAIPAVLGYNILGRFITRIEADLEGFARDLRELLLTQK